MSDPEYFLGRTDEETQRLVNQARLLDGATELMLRKAGVTEGMRVLDLGSGAGDVAFLAAQVVGPSGAVTSVDLNPDILHVARGRASSLGLDNVTFLHGDFRELELNGNFDAIIGRYVMLYVDDPKATLERLLHSLNPNGVVAFHELDYDMVERLLPLYPPLAHTCFEWFVELFKRTGVNCRLGQEFYEIYTSLGLKQVELFAYTMMGGPDWSGWSFGMDTIRSALPALEQHGIVTAEEMDIDTLEERLKREVATTMQVVPMGMTVAGWGRKP